MESIIKVDWQIHTKDIQQMKKISKINLSFFLGNALLNLDRFLFDFSQCS